MDSLLVSDPQRFMGLVMQDDPKERQDGLKTLDDIVLCEILRYGIHNDARMIPDLQQLYRARFMRVPTERRGEVFRHVKGMVENVDYVSFNAFLPFIAEDDDRAIVSTAVIDYVSLASPTDDDPMSRPRDIVGMIEGGMLKNEGAAGDVNAALQATAIQRALGMSVETEKAFQTGVRMTVTETLPPDPHLLKFLLERRMPGQYRETKEVVHTHNAGLLFQKVLERMDAQAKLAPPAVIDLVAEEVRPEPKGESRRCSLVQRGRQRCR